jgi:hypothetical protein
MKVVPFVSTSALAFLAFSPQAFSTMIAGTDFSDSAVFNAPGGGFAKGSMDDLDPGDGIIVSGWSFANGGGFIGFDANAQVGMPNET